MHKEKQFLIDEIEEQLEKHNDFAIFQYSKISANAMSDFRTSIHELGGDVQMVRKRILLKIFKTTGLNFKFELPGHIGLAFSGTDAIEMTKSVFEFSKETNEAFDVLGGRFDGKLYDAKKVKELSKLPGKDQMRAQLLGLLEAPMSQTVAVVNALLAAVPCCLENKSNKE